MAELSIIIGIASIISSGAAFTAQTSKTIKRLKGSDREIEHQMQEINVMCEVLQECDGIIKASRDAKIPDSIPQALESCQVRYVEMMDLMERFRNERLESNTAISRLRRVMKQSASESERKSAFSAFRNAALLLRDLCTDIRLQQQLVNMSAGLAELMVDYSDETSTAKSRLTQLEHVQISEEGDDFVADRIARTLTTDLATRTQRNTVGLALKDLIKQNFTRNATLVVDSGVGTFPERVRYVHVRAKMDTGCSDNLITMELVEKAGIPTSMLFEIPEDELVDLQGLEGAKCTPLYEVHLTWYQDGDMKMRESSFYVIKDGPFDMLIGSRRFAQDLHDNPALIVGRLKKKKADREAQKAEKARYLQDQRDAEIARRDAEASSNGQAPIPMSNLASQAVTAQSAQLSQQPTQSPFSSSPQQTSQQTSQASTQPISPSRTTAPNQGPL